MSKKIQMVNAREIFDSRGNPTIEVDVLLNDESLGRSSVPSGASTGDKEAVELRDGGKRLGGINTELPLPFFNVINGGKHADSGINIQEFLITPIGFSSFHEGIESIAETYHTLKSLLSQRGLVTSVGDEGGFAPHLESSEEAIELLIQAIEKAGYIPKRDIAIALDPAASEFYENGIYNFEGGKLSSEEMTLYYEKLLDKYPIISIEDGLSEYDWNGWEFLTKKLKDRTQLVGDDIFVTNPSILKKGIEKHIANSVLIKLNQIGTITETIKTIKIARESGYTTMISHRSGETEDTFIADFAVGLSAGQIKTGSMSRTERICKYNQFLRIEEELGRDCIMTPFKLKK